MEKLFETLQEEWHRRRSQLLDASRYYNFIRQVNDLTSWLNDKERLALREDYGVDLEECRALIEEFELAIRELSASGERLHSVINYAKQVTLNIWSLFHELLVFRNNFSALVTHTKLQFTMLYVSLRTCGAELTTLLTTVNKPCKTHKKSTFSIRKQTKFSSGKFFSNFIFPIFPFLVWKRKKLKLSLWTTKI